MTYLIVGVDRRTLAPWHRNVLARDIPTAQQLARTRAAAEGVALVVAAVIGPYSCVLDAPDAAAATVSAA
jgi:hypothetical protein